MVSDIQWNDAAARNILVTHVHNIYTVQFLVFILCGTVFELEI